MTVYRPIGDYALIGDCRSAALVSSEGAIDWACFPRFDSPSIFGALLDPDLGGFFRIRPAGSFQTARRYVPETNVLETTFHCSGGAFVLRDLMPVASEEQKHRELTPDHEILREIEVTQGEVSVEIDYQPRPDYGRAPRALEDRRSLGIWLDSSEGSCILTSDLELQVTRDGNAATARVHLVSGQRRYASFSFCEDAPAVIPALGAVANEKVERTIRWWRDWAQRCSYEGPFREAIVRSCLVLKLMAYAPSGAVIAAPTTSLPERLGGVRNWDYRYCWLRDAAFTLRALFNLNYREEAQAFLDWALHATRLTAPELQVVYDVYGETNLPEKELTHLRGFHASRPVRIGNDAHGQLQLDVYGEVIEAVAHFAELGGQIDRDTERFLDALGHTVCKRWREPDEGIWEVRAGRAHHTHSKVLCWVALDRLIRLREKGLIKVRVDDFRRERDAVRAAIEERGYNTRIDSYTGTFEGEDVDASLLTLPLYGFTEGGDPRMRSTYNLIRQRLSDGDLIYRYRESTEDGLPPGEGAFGICSFWAVECLALAGELDAARTLFERLLSYANDVGLLGEQVDPADGTALGNFPQAFTHIGIINAALTLAVTGEQTLTKPGERPESSL